MPTPLQIHSLWGQVFEIAVKRGVLVRLMASGLIRPDHPSVADWRTLAAADAYGALAAQLAETDPNQKARTRETARHLFLLGMGLGQTATREYLQRFADHVDDYVVRALWCPLQLPRIEGDFDAETDRSLEAFWSAFGFDGKPDPALVQKGFPARADFLLWLEPKHAGRDRALLCLEFSLNGLPDTADFTTPSAHLDELRRHSWYLDSRGVFSRVCAEVSGEGFELSPRMKDHLAAFTSRDKPLYKLCQAASYVETTLRVFQSKGLNDTPCNARALSITQNGIESIAAAYFKRTDARVALIESLGRAYRDTEKLPDGDEQALIDHIRHAFDQIRKALPRTMSRALATLRDPLQPGADLHFDFGEEVAGFRNPMHPFTWKEALEQVDSSDPLSQFLGCEARDVVARELELRGDTRREVPLRDLHAAALRAGMNASKVGTLTVLGLEGNPGIGKTTAVANYLKRNDQGFLFLYVSPRVIINDDVIGKLAASDGASGGMSGVLCVTTNSRLNASARYWYETQVAEHGAGRKLVDSAVVADGVENLVEPESSTLILKPEQKESLETTHTGARTRKRAETERQDRIEDLPSPGVLAVLAGTTCLLLKENPGVSQVVLTAAIQGYRELGGNKTTLDALSKLFRSKVTTTPGLNERREFAKRIPTIVVMVDELTGDGAGALFVHSVVRWLRQEFLDAFKSEPLFRVILVVSDASLGNEIVLDRYLNSGERAPDKVLISPSQGQRPFRLAAHPVRIGGSKVPVLHVMTNSYPASSLSVDYRVRLNVVKPETLPDGRSQTIRRAIVDQQGQALLGNAATEIERAIAAGADQVIFFAQDKRFLRDLMTRLTSGEEDRPAIFRHGQVEILDSSVAAARRKKLIADDRRDTIKVFLMTSSGARGVSFPKTDWIIALLPRFHIEAALMEVAQLIYRGRGSNYQSDDGAPQSDGDWKQRRLVMLLQDFLPQQEKPEPRQWLRQVSDLLTFVVMLRATILTRITGDAGLERRRLALVPVGSIGAEEMQSLMSTQVAEFLCECDVFLRDSASPQGARGLVTNARRYAVHLFSKFSLDGMGKGAGLRSAVRIHDVARLAETANADNAALLLDPRAEPDSVLPERLACVGPYWLEHWDAVEKQERFNVEGWLTNVGNEVEALFGELGRIKDERDLPGRLRRSAEELYRMLAREKEEATREYSTVKSLKSPSTWLAVPLDYPRFWKTSTDGKAPSLDGEDEVWRDSLGRCLGGMGTVLPVIPRYSEAPYAATVGGDDPARMGMIFDDRYFAATNELNLLNSLLIADAEEIK